VDDSETNLDWTDKGNDYDEKSDESPEIDETENQLCYDGNADLSMPL